MAKNYFNYKTYQMRSADYELMLKDQDGCCAICKTKPPKGTRLDIDHDHSTQDVRGLLCGPCNRMIGLGQDNPEVLRAAADYVENNGHPSRFHIETGSLLKDYSPE